MILGTIGKLVKLFKLIKVTALAIVLRWCVKYFVRLLGLCPQIHIPLLELDPGDFRPTDPFPRQTPRLTDRPDSTRLRAVHQWNFGGVPSALAMLLERHNIPRRLRNIDDYDDPYIN